MEQFLTSSGLEPGAITNESGGSSQTRGSSSVLSLPLLLTWRGVGGGDSGHQVH